MAVNISWKDSAAAGASDLSDPLDHGSKNNGQTTDVETLYVRHDGDNEITDCKFYLTAFTGTYDGASSASADFSEILGWGDGTTAASFGGVLLSMDSSTFPTGPADKSGTDYETFRTGVGDSAANGISLTTSMGAAITSLGVMAASDNNASFQLKIQIPTDEDTAGKRQFDLKLRYTFTS